MVKTAAAAAWFVGAVVALAPVAVRGQGATAAPIAGASQAPAPPPQRCGNAPVVLRLAGGIDSLPPHSSKIPPSAYLGDYVTIGVCHLDSLQAWSLSAEQPLSLFVNGVDFGLAPIGIDDEAQSITFTLDRTAANKAFWAPLLYNPILDREVVLRASVGVKGRFPIPVVRPGANHLVLHKLYVDGWVWTSFALILVSWMALAWLADRTDLLRNGPKVDGRPQQYSLGKSQMAWWFALGLGAFVFIWVIDGATDSISPSLLVLMGVSAGTGLAATILTPSASTRAATIRSATKAQLQTLDAARDAGPPGAPASAGVPARPAGRSREVLVARLASEGALLESRGFWRDIITDDTGAIALDRLQMVCWTLVLSVIFLYSVLWELVIPDFSTTLLLLIGISSGTYLGFKLPAARS